jgi:hypothetical protein
MIGMSMVLFGLFLLFMVVIRLLVMEIKRKDWVFVTCILSGIFTALGTTIAILEQ